MLLIINKFKVKGFFMNNLGIFMESMGIIDGVTWYTEISWSSDNATARVFGLEKRGDF